MEMEDSAAVPAKPGMEITDMRQGRCPGCGASEIYEADASRPNASIMLMLQDTYSHKILPLQTLICVECGRIQQQLSLNEKQKEFLKRALVRKIT
jgi:predicted RNA-binding Zn-ribbon protein involved in translation (DUF1610 family)